MDDKSLSREEIQCLVDAEGPQLASRPTHAADAAAAADPAQSRVEAVCANLPPAAERLGAAIAEKLSTTLRLEASCRLTHVTSRTLGENLLSPDSPTCLLTAVDNSGQFTGFMEVRPAILFAIFDRLLGGAGKPGDLPARPLTEIEQRLAKRVGRLIFEAIGNVLHSPLSADLFVPTAGNGAVDGTLLPTSQAIICVEFDVQLADQNGVVQWSMPVDIAEGMIQPAVFAGQRSAELVAQLATMEIDTNQIGDIAPGHIIPTESSPAAPVDIIVDGKLRFRGNVGSLSGRKAVCLQPVAAQR